MRGVSVVVSPLSGLLHRAGASNNQSYVGLALLAFIVLVTDMLLYAQSFLMSRVTLNDQADRDSPRVAQRGLLPGILYMATFVQSARFFSMYMLTSKPEEKEWQSSSLRSGGADIVIREHKLGA